MLLYYICLMLPLITKGDDTFVGRHYMNTINYDGNIKNPMLYQYLPSARQPFEDNDPSLKIYKFNEGHHVQHPHIKSLIYGNPLLEALLLGTIVDVPPIKYQSFNHPEQEPINPYITLLLSQYGRYLPIHARGAKGLYYYGAANNYHNNKPFGSYKVYEEKK